MLEKNKIVFLTCILVNVMLLVSCQTKEGDKEKELKQTLKKDLKLDMFDIVHTGDTVIAYNEFRKKYKYLSVVYLTDGCKPCYPKFIKWNKELNKFRSNENYSVLFVIQGYSYDSFLKAVKDNSGVIASYNIIMDPNFEYVDTNEIPQWIIDRSILIDASNRIKLIGAPFENNEMTKLFYSIVNN